MLDMVVFDRNILLWLLGRRWKLPGGSRRSTCLKMVMRMKSWRRKRNRDQILLSVYYLVSRAEVMIAVMMADCQQTRKTHSTSTTSGYLQRLLRILRYSMTKTRNLTTPPQPRVLMAKLPSLRLESRPSLPTLPACAESTNNESLVETRSAFLVDASLVLGDSALHPELFLLSLPTLACTSLLLSTLEKMKVIRSSEHLNRRGGSLRLVV